MQWGVNAKDAKVSDVGKITPPSPEKIIENNVRFAKTVSSVEDDGKWDIWEMSGIPQGKQIVVLDKGVSDKDIIVAIVFCKRTSGEIHGIIYRPWDHLDLNPLVQYEGKKFNNDRKGVFQTIESFLLCTSIMEIESESSSSGCCSIS